MLQEKLQHVSFRLHGRLMTRYSALFMEAAVPRVASAFVTSTQTAALFFFYFLFTAYERAGTLTVKIVSFNILSSDRAALALGV